MTVAVVLIALAALAVAGAAVTGSWPLTTVSGALAVVLGGIATRIVHTELLDSRRLAARDRAEQAQAFNRIEDQRTADHEAHAAELRSVLARRTAEHQEARGQLEAALSSAQRRAATATRRFRAEPRRP